MAYCDNDLTAILPDGRMFEFWEAEPVFEREIHVDNQTLSHPTRMTVPLNAPQDH